MLPGIKLFDLKGKTAIVTGGSKGLGQAMAAGLASAGANLVLVSRHEDEARAAARDMAKDFGCRAEGVRADVSLQSDMEAVAAHAQQEFGGVDILVNNAGINIRGPIDKLTLEDFRKVQQVNVEGVWLAARAVVPHMKSRKYGRIINLASTLGLVGLADRTPYTSSKGAVVQMTRALSMELAPFGITVNAICPGPFLTEMNRPLVERNDPQFMSQVVGATAMGRLAEMHEIQGAALFLASDASSYVTGAIIPVDGGWTAH